MKRTVLLVIVFLLVLALCNFIPIPYSAAQPFNSPELTPPFRPTPTGWLRETLMPGSPLATPENPIYTIGTALARNGVKSNIAQASRVQHEKAGPDVSPLGLLYWRWMIFHR